MDKQKNGNKWHIYLILGGFLVEIMRFLYKKIKPNQLKSNLGNFFKEEKREVKELRTGQESLRKFCHDSCSLVVDYFIPHECNSYKPKILRTQSLAIILIALVAMKFFVTGYLFFIYPNEARMQEQMTEEILKMTNDDRVLKGLPPLQMNSTLAAAAQAKAEDMGAKNYFAHYSPDGKKPWDWIDRNQYSYLFVGENLGMNFATAKAVHLALMDSLSHRKNILNSRYEDIGLAVISCVIDGEKTNVLVELFGKEVGKNLAVNTEPASTAGTTINNQTATKANPQVLGTAKVTNNQSQTSTSEKLDNKIATPTNSLLAVKDKNLSSAPTEIKSAETSVTGNQEATIVNDAGLNKEVRFVAPVPEKKIGFATTLVRTSKIIYLGVLLLMITALLVNIFVRFKIQHRSIIIQTVVVILLITGLLSVNFHILERASDLISLI